jgi:peptidoglycan hydrolase CwlO-like protein
MHDELDKLREVVDQLTEGLGTITTAYLGQRIVILDAKIGELQKRLSDIESRIDNAAASFRVLSNRQQETKAKVGKLEIWQASLDKENGK